LVFRRLAPDLLRRAKKGRTRRKNAVDRSRRPLRRGVGAPRIVPHSAPAARGSLARPRTTAAQNRTLTQTIVNGLTQQIVNGSLMSGSSLDETRLAEHFGVSRTPVREAQRQMAASGLTETLDTPDHLAEAGIRYIADFVVDDLPCPAATRPGTVFSRPHTVELNDIPVQMIQHHAGGAAGRR
jgi:hypothetical protein